MEKVIDEIDEIEGMKLFAVYKNEIPMYLYLVDENGKIVEPNKEEISKEWKHLWIKGKNNVGKEDKMDPLLLALRALSGDDMDFAQEHNGVGFSGADSEFGHSLASRDFLTLKQKPYAIRIIKKYKKQLQKNYPLIWSEVENIL